MWDLTLDRYLAEYLSPAMDEYTKTGASPNCFTRYGLPVSADNDGDIAEALRAVPGFWNNLKIQNPKYQALVGVLLAPNEFKAARDLLADPRARDRERQVISQRRSVRKEALLRELDAELKLYSTDGTIDLRIFQRLLEKFGAHGLTDAEIEGRNRARLVTRAAASTALPDEGLPAVVRLTLAQKLHLLDKRDIYDFLELDDDPSPAQVLDALARKTERLERSANDDARAATQTLVSMIKAHCPDGDLDKYRRGLLRDRVAQLQAAVAVFGAKAEISGENYAALVERGVTLGLPRAIADKYVKAFARDLGAFIDPSAQAAYEVCPHCGAATPPHAAACPGCGSSFVSICRGCGVQKSARQALCPHCQLFEPAWPVIEQALRKAATAAAQREWRRLRQLLQDVETQWSGAARSPEVYRLRQQLDDAAEAGRRNVDVLRERIVERRMYEASGLLEGLQQIDSGSLRVEGRPLPAVAADVDSAISQSRGLVARGRTLEGAGKRRDAAEAFRRALEVAIDCTPASEGLARCGLRGPASAAARQHGEHSLIVEWPPAPDHGRVRYVVRRGIGMAPESPSDGEEIGSTAETSLVDPHASSVGVCGYAVFAEDQGLHSAPALTPPTPVFREVDRLEIQGGDAVVNGTWLPTPPATTRVRVVRRDKGVIRGMFSAVEIEAGRTGFEDRAVVNRRHYDYKVTVIYDVAGRAFETNGQTLRVQPKASAVWVWVLVAVVVVLMLVGAMSEGAVLPDAAMPAVAMSGGLR